MIRGLSYVLIFVPGIVWGFGLGVYKCESNIERVCSILEGCNELDIVSEYTLIKSEEYVYGEDYTLLVRSPDRSLEVKVVEGEEFIHSQDEGFRVTFMYGMNTFQMHRDLEDVSRVGFIEIEYMGGGELGVEMRQGECWEVDKEVS